ncbi:hypothetical protein HpCK38_16410 [Helicobacter pylori]
MAELRIWIIPCIIFGVFLALISAILVYTYSDMDDPLRKCSKEVNKSVTSMEDFQKAMDAKLK